MFLNLFKKPKLKPRGLITKERSHILIKDNTLKKFVSQYMIYTSGEDSNYLRHLYQEYKKDYLVYDVYPELLLGRALRIIKSKYLRMLNEDFLYDYYYYPLSDSNNLRGAYSIPSDLIELIDEMVNQTLPYRDSIITQKFQRIYKGMWISIWKDLYVSYNQNSDIRISALAKWLEAIKMYLVKFAKDKSYEIQITNICNRLINNHLNSILND